MQGLALPLELLDLHRHGIRQFGPQLAGDFFPDNLRRQETLTAIGDLVVRVEVDTLRQEPAHRLFQRFKIGLFQRRKWNNLGKITLFREHVQVRQQAFPLFNLVDLVHRQDHRAFQPAEFLQHHLIRGRPGQLVHHEHHHIDINERRRGRLVHVTVNGPGLILMHARCVHVDRLHRPHGLDAKHLMTGGLRLAGSDAQLLPEDMVQQCGLAHIRTANDGHKTAATVRVFRTGDIVHYWFSTPSSFRALRAACCSATRRLLPVPVVFRSSDGSAQDTWNVWL